MSDVELLYLTPGITSLFFIVGGYLRSRNVGDVIFIFFHETVHFLQDDIEDVQPENGVNGGDATETDTQTAYRRTNEIADQ